MFVFVLQSICVFVNKRSEHFFKIVVVNPQQLAKDTICNPETRVAMQDCTPYIGTGLQCKY